MQRIRIARLLSLVNRLRWVKVNYKAAAEPGDQTLEGISSFFWSRVTIVSHLVGLFGQLLLLLPRYYILQQCLFANRCLGRKGMQRTISESALLAINTARQ